MFQPSMLNIRLSPFSILIKLSPLAHFLVKRPESLFLFSKAIFDLYGNLIEKFYTAAIDGWRMYIP